MSSDDEQERRRPGIPIEKMAGLVISGAALAFAVYTAGSSFVAGIQRDINAIALEQSELSSRIDAYYRERDPWIERIRLLESRCNEVRERLGAEPRR